MKVLIVGANSLLSQSLMRLLRQSGKYEIFGIYNKSKNNLSEKVNYLSFSEIDQLPDDIGVVFFLASFINYNDLNLVDSRLIDSNLTSLIKYTEKYPKAKFIYTSSISIHGSGSEIITEMSDYGPNSNYAISKLSGELIIKSLDNYSILRLTSIYGIGVSTDTFLPRCINDALDNKTISLYGKGNRKQNYVNYKDVAMYLFSCLKSEINGTYLASSVDSYSNLEVAQIIQSCLSNVKIDFIKEDTSTDTFCDNSWTRKKLNINLDTPLKEGIEEVLKWRKKQY